MNTFTPSFVENIAHRRQLVTEINLFDIEHGIATSQRAKYEKPHWAFVAGLLCGRDVQVTEALNCHQISNSLAAHGVFIKPNAIYRIIQAMKRPGHSIKPSIRAHGQSCLEIVRAFGGIREYTTSVVVDGVTYPTQAYYFGETHDEVLRLRRVFAQIVQVKP
jgi:hypothetical protein